jgi:hypothetical protein
MVLPPTGDLLPSWDEVRGVPRTLRPNYRGPVARFDRSTTRCASFAWRTSGDPTRAASAPAPPPLPPPSAGGACGGGGGCQRVFWVVYASTDRRWRSRSIGSGNVRSRAPLQASGSAMLPPLAFWIERYAAAELPRPMRPRSWNRPASFLISSWSADSSGCDISKMRKPCQLVPHARLPPLSHRSR